MKYKVIVADDEDVIRKGIVYLIDWDKLNCEIVQECTDGLQVLKYLEKNTADIVITDIKMPKLSGIELMEEIDKKHKGLKMILVTAYTDFEFARKALRYGAVDFVVKNDIITDLPKAVKKAVWQYETEKKEREKEQISEREYQNIQGYVLESLLLSKALNSPEVLLSLLPPLSYLSLFSLIHQLLSFLLLICSILFILFFVNGNMQNNKIFLSIRSNVPTHF